MQASGRVRVNVPVTFGILHLAPLWGQLSVKTSRAALNFRLMTSAPLELVVSVVAAVYELMSMAMAPAATAQFKLVCPLAYHCFAAYHPPCPPSS